MGVAVSDFFFDELTNNPDLKKSFWAGEEVEDFNEF